MIKNPLRKKYQILVEKKIKCNCTYCKKKYPQDRATFALREWHTLTDEEYLEMKTCFPKHIFREVQK